MKKSNKFVPSKPLNTAVLFLIFNRLETTKLVFKQIKEAKPPKLYIACDGARQSRPDEEKKVQEIRDYVVEHIDWDCEVKTLFRNQNLGCKIAVSQAIDWFFKNETQGIILEDDCLPNQSFFWFCEEMLNYYNNDWRVWHISGDNFQNGKKRGNGGYYFSNYTHIWGWATWANRWKSYDVDMSSYKEFVKNKKIESIFENPREQKYWLKVFEAVKSGKIDTWDYQWSYCAFVNNGLSILPNENLIENIGFGIDATHTYDENSKLAKLETSDIDFPIEHPKFMLRDKAADDLTAKDQFRRRSFIKRAIQKIKL